MRGTLRGFTLVEFVIVIVVTGVVALTVPSLIFHGVKTMVFLPRALAVNNAAGEVMHQVIEGGYSTLAGQTTVRGLRFAVRRSATEPALWVAQGSQIGYRTPEGQLVLIRRDGNTIKRSVAAAPSCSPVASAEESIPYDMGGVQIGQIDLSTPVFRYYNQSGALIAFPNCPSGLFVIRRVDMTFVAQTGNGNFAQGHAQESMTSSAAIRVP